MLTRVRHKGCTCKRRSGFTHGQKPPLHWGLQWLRAYTNQGRIKASAGPGAVTNVGHLQTYKQLTANCFLALFWLHPAATLLNIFRDIMNDIWLRIFQVLNSFKSIYLTLETTVIKFTLTIVVRASLRNCSVSLNTLMLLQDPSFYKFQLYTGYSS